MSITVVSESIQNDYVTLTFFPGAIQPQEEEPTIIKSKVVQIADDTRYVVAIAYSHDGWIDLDASGCATKQQAIQTIWNMMIDHDEIDPLGLFQFIFQTGEPYFLTNPYTEESVYGNGNANGNVPLESIQLVRKLMPYEWFVRFNAGDDHNDNKQIQEEYDLYLKTITLTEEELEMYVNEFSSAYQRSILYDTEDILFAYKIHPVHIPVRHSSRAPKPTERMTEYLKTVKK